VTRSIGIRGAGVSGLSVARELLKRDSSLAVTIFDTRARLPHPERTFSFFRFPGDCVPVSPEHSWPSVQFRGAAFDRKIDVSGSPYVMVSGERFFSESLALLEEAGVKFIWSCPEVLLSERSISTEATGVVNFDVVIDAAFSTREAHATLWQSFAGLWVSTEVTTFDPSTAILMDLGRSSPQSPVSFMYVLPTSPTSALVEHTTFSIAPQERDWHLAQCREWLATNTRGRYEVTAREHGLIPMGLASQPRSSKFQIGSRAGAVRPATGYAFVSIQEQAIELSHRVLDFSGKNNRARSPHPWWMVLGDSVFMRSLVCSPERGAALLGGLLAKASPDLLVRFLSGKVRLAQALRVWWCVPKWEMLRALFGIRSGRMAE